MELLLWQFWIYSFLGYLLERGYAAATHAPNQVRKCFLLLPLCPVYGLGVLAVLALPVECKDGFFALAWWGGLAATAVEYGVHAAYEYWFHVHFWDYKDVWGNLKGRVCVPFSIVWGLLLAAGFPAAQEILIPWICAIPPEVTYGALLLFTADTVVSVRILRRTADPTALSLAAFA